MSSKIYSLYGLRVRSAIALPCPEWHRTGNEPDVELVECLEDDFPEPCKAATTYFENDGFWECRQFDDGAARVAWKDHFEFHVSGDGTRVLWRRLLGVPDEVLFTYLLNQVLSHCLVLRGVEPLHATSVVVNGKAIAIMGDSGYGKSTLAAALLRKGYPLLTDDLMALEFLGTGIRAHPSLARLKLHPDSADAAFERRRSLPMNTFTDKMILPLEISEHVAYPVPLGAIFVIPSSSGSDAITIRRAEGQQAMLPLIKNSFNAAFLNRQRLEQQFDFACRLAKSVPISLLSFPRRLDLLPAVAGALLADLLRTAGLR